MPSPNTTGKFGQKEAAATGRAASDHLDCSLSFAAAREQFRDAVAVGLGAVATAVP
jgi:hypothetical protein